MKAAMTRIVTTAKTELTGPSPTFASTEAALPNLSGSSAALFCKLTAEVVFVLQVAQRGVVRDEIA
jgi:hypothetical protein